VKLTEAFGARGDLEQNGVWVPIYGQTGDMCEVLLARAGGRNSAYEALLLQLTRPHRREIEAGYAPPSLMEGILAEVFARTVVKGWRGLGGESGDIPFSPAKAKELFLEYPDFFQVVRERAVSAQTFTQADTEAVAGN